MTILRYSVFSMKRSWRQPHRPRQHHDRQRLFQRNRGGDCGGAALEPERHLHPADGLHESLAAQCLARALHRPPAGDLSGLRLSPPAAGAMAQDRTAALLACAGFFAAGSTFYLTALEGASVANVSCLTASSPVFAALLAWIFLRERADARIWLATIPGHRRHRRHLHAGRRLQPAEPRRQFRRLADGLLLRRPDGGAAPLSLGRHGAGDRRRRGRRVPDPGRRRREPGDQSP